MPKIVRYEKYQTVRGPQGRGLSDIFHNELSKAFNVLKTLSSDMCHVTVQFSNISYGSVNISAGSPNIRRCREN